MTRRERLENKLAKREEWSAKRRSAAASVFQAHEKYRGDHAFNTQPGHIPERARVIRREEKAFESLQVANHHDSCAKGIERALDTSIFSDDSDAVQALEGRIAEREAERTTMREANKIVRLKPKNERTDEKVAKLMALGLEQGKAISLFTADFCGRFGFADYELSNLGGRITADKKRIEAVKARQAKTAAAEAAPGGVNIRTGGEGVTAWAEVTFAEKPAREILDALRAANFHWSGGSWFGSAEKIPSEVRALIATNAPPAEAAREA